MCICEVCCSVLQCVAVCCSVLQCVVVCVAVWYSVLQCVAVRCSVLQCVAVGEIHRMSSLYWSTSAKQPCIFFLGLLKRRQRLTAVRNLQKTLGQNVQKSLKCQRWCSGGRPEKQKWFVCNTNLLPAYNRTCTSARNTCFKRHSRRQHTATHCNTLQYTTTHCNTLQHTATHCNTLQHTATHCNTLQHTKTRHPMGLRTL